jgi:hypothetical protein
MKCFDIQRLQRHSPQPFGPREFQPRCSRRVGRRAHRCQDADGTGHPAQREGEHMGGRRVDPLQVVDGHQYRARRGQRVEYRLESRGDGAPIGSRIVDVDP